MICTVIRGRTLEEITLLLQGGGIEMAEIRLDSCPLTLDEIGELFSGTDIPLVATCRCRGGRAAWEEAEKRLMAAIEAGAAYADLEIEAPSPVGKRIRQHCRECGTILIRSFHDFSGVPAEIALRAMGERCAMFGGEIVKLAGMARTPEDAARMLWPYSDTPRPELLIAFAMGEAGRATRLECLRLGAPFTYAALPGEEELGQWPTPEMRAAVYGNAPVSVPAAEYGKDAPVSVPAAPIPMPASKSFAQRAILMAALADGTSHLSGYSPCGDNESAIAVAEALGATVRRDRDVLTITGIAAADGAASDSAAPDGAVSGSAVQDVAASPGGAASNSAAADTASLGNAVQDSIAHAAAPDAAVPATGTAPDVPNTGTLVALSPEKRACRPQKWDVSSTPLQLHTAESPLELHTGESGLLTRLVIPVIAALTDRPVHITGEKTLLGRPLSTAHDLMAAFGVRLHPDATAKTDPLRPFDCYLPLTVKGPLLPGRAELSGKGGSQLISGLLTALPLCPGRSTVYIEEPRSIPYLFITLDVLKRFGVRVGSEMEGGGDFLESQDWSLCTGITFKIPGGQRFHAADFRIEGDWSGAAPFLVAGAIFGEAELSGLDTSSLQADLSILDILTEAGASLSQIEEGSSTGNIHVMKAPLSPFETDLTNCPDLFPVVAVLAAFCPGESRLTGTERLMHKETDRAAAVVDMLTRFGVPARIEENVLIVSGMSLARRLLTGNRLKGGLFSSYGDHRMAMAASIAALGADGPVEIDDTACLAKSFPDFLPLLHSWSSALTAGSPQEADSLST